MSCAIFIEQPRVPIGSNISPTLNEALMSIIFCILLDKDFILWFLVYFQGARRSWRRWAVRRERTARPVAAVTQPPSLPVPPNPRINPKNQKPSNYSLDRCVFPRVISFKGKCSLGLWYFGPVTLIPKFDLDEFCTCMHFGTSWLTWIQSALTPEE